MRLQIIPKSEFGIFCKKYKFLPHSIIIGFGGGTVNQIKSGGVNKIAFALQKQSFVTQEGLNSKISPLGGRKSVQKRMNKSLPKAGAKKAPQICGATNIYYIWGIQILSACFSTLKLTSG